VVGNTGLGKEPGSTVTFVNVAHLAPGKTVSVHGLPGAIVVVPQAST